MGHQEAETKQGDNLKPEGEIPGAIQETEKSKKTERDESNLGEPTAKRARLLSEEKPERIRGKASIKKE